MLNTKFIEVGFEKSVLESRLLLRTRLKRKCVKYGFSSGGILVNPGAIPLDALLAFYFNFALLVKQKVPSHNGLSTLSLFCIFIIHLEKMRYLRTWRTGAQDNNDHSRKHQIRRRCDLELYWNENVSSISLAKGPLLVFLLLCKVVMSL